MQRKRVTLPLLQLLLVTPSAPSVSHTGTYYVVKVAGKLTCKVSFRFSKTTFLRTYKISTVSSMHSILSTYVLLNSTYAPAEPCM